MTNASCPKITKTVAFSNSEEAGASETWMLHRIQLVMYILESRLTYLRDFGSFLTNDLCIAAFSQKILEYFGLRTVCCFNFQYEDIL